MLQTVLSARTESKLQAVADEIRTAGGEVVVVAGDVSKVKPLRIESRGKMVCLLIALITFKVSYHQGLRICLS